MLPRNMLSPSFNVPGFVNMVSKAGERCQSSVISCRLSARVGLLSTRGGQGQWRGNWISPSGPMWSKPGCGLELPKRLLWPTALAEHLSGFLPYPAFICPTFLAFETHTAGKHPCAFWINHASSSSRTWHILEDNESQAHLTLWIT